MTTITGAAGRWGPHDDHGEHLGAIAADGGPLAKFEHLLEIFRYDGVLVDVIVTPEGVHWLRYIYDDGPPPSGQGGLPDRLENRTHYLRIGTDAKPMIATMHDGGVPTRESYVMAEAIVSEIETGRVWGELGARENGGFVTERRDVSIDEALAEDPIYLQMRPGSSMSFGPFDDAWEPLKGDDARFHDWPLPRDRILTSMDGDRIWVGRFPNRPGEIHLVNCIGETQEDWIQHRLSFAEKDERAMLDSLAAGMAPTMQTYRLANRILKETVSEVTGGQLLLVDEVQVDSPDFDRPTYENVASHDRRWPSFARRAGRG
jgi:hypothetical protein